MEYKNMSNAELDNLVYKEKNYEAMCELGRRLLYGLDGREKKPGEARKYFNKAAKKGCLEGYRYIGDMYKEGIYFARSDKMAEKYYQLAQGIVPTTSIEPAPPINPTPPVAPTPPAAPTPPVAPTPPLRRHLRLHQPLLCLQIMCKNRQLQAVQTARIWEVVETSGTIMLAHRL